MPPAVLQKEGHSNSKEEFLLLKMESKPKLVCKLELLNQGSLGRVQVCESEEEPNYHLDFH